MSVQRTVVIVALSAIAVAPAVLAQGRAIERAQSSDQTRRQSAQEMRLRGMDGDNDGVITRAEWRGNDQSFREQDGNDDGVLSGDEVRPRAGAVAARRGQRARREALMARFGAMDADNDGVITRAEWSGNAQSFREQDGNADGVLSGAEVRPASGQAAPPDRNRREQMAARFERSDRNRDGRLTRAEWPGNDAMFNRMDKDRNLVVTYDEFSAVVDNRIAGRAGARTATRAYQTGYDRGLAEGREAGREDKTVNGGTWDLDGQRELQQADSGYREEVGARADYQSGYRAGFRVGYREGFGPRR